MKNKIQSLSWKYGSVFFITVILFIISSLLVHSLLSSTRDEVTRMNDTTNHVQTLSEMELLTQQKFLMLSQFMVDPGDIAARLFQERHDEFKELVDEITPHIDSEEAHLLFETAIENDQEIVIAFFNYADLHEDERTDRLSRRTLSDAGAAYQTSSFTFGELRNIFNNERDTAAESTYASVDRTTTILLYSILLSVIVGISMLFIVNRGVKKNLRSIITFSEDISNGNLSVSDLAIKGEGEFARIADSLNLMKLGLKTILGEISKVSTSINQRTEELDGTSSFLNSESKVVSDRLHELIAIVEEQSAAVSEISDTNNRFNKRIHSVEQSSQDIRSSSFSVSESTQAGISQMNDSVKRMQYISKTVDHSVSQIDELVSRAEEMSNFTQKINNIAEKTNLLAINASIEAARAGSHGKGFAVVAEEIRHLSSDVNHSIKEMNVIIDGFHSESVIIANELQTSSDHTLQEQKKMEVNIDSLKEIESSIQQLVSKIDDSSSSLSSMATESGEINFSIEELSELSTKTTSFIDEASQSVYQQNGMINDMTQHSANLYHNVELLSAAMERFYISKNIEANHHPNDDETEKKMSLIKKTIDKIQKMGEKKVS